MAKRKRTPARATADPDDFAARHARLLAQALKDPESLPGMHATEGNPRTLAPRLPEVADWANTQITNTVNAAERWKKNTMTPRKDPIAEAKKAGPKWENAVKKAIADKNFEKGLAATDEEAMIDAIDKTDPSDFARAVQKREMKITHKLDRLRPLVVAHCQAIDALPTDTEAQREDKVIKNLRGMRAIKAAMRK